MTTIQEMGKKAKIASRTLLTAGEKKNDALKAIAKALRENADKIISANQIDLDNGVKNGLSASLLDRLKLDNKRIDGIADGVLEVAALPDPIGTVISGSTRPNGMEITKVRVPLGVIGIIFEARPNVTADAAVLCLKSGNAVILRGGKEAINSNKCITYIMQKVSVLTEIPFSLSKILQDNLLSNSWNLQIILMYSFHEAVKVLYRLLLKMQKYPSLKRVQETVMYTLMKVQI